MQEDIRADKPKVNTDNELYANLKSKKSWLKPVITISCIVCVLCGLGFTVYKCMDMQSQVAANEAIYEAKCEENEALLKREQLLESMVEYARSDSYMMQLARERFGYVLPNDVIFTFNIDSDSQDAKDEGAETND